MLTAISPKNTKITEITRNDNQIFLKSERSVIRIIVYSEDIFRVSYVEEIDDNNKKELFSTEQGREFLPPQKTKFDVLETEFQINIKTKKLICNIERESGAVSFERVGANGEKEARLVGKLTHQLEAFDTYNTVGNINIEEIKTADGVKKRIISADKEYDKTLFHTRVNFAFQEAEKIFGLGQAEEGCWNLRGTTQYLHQANKKIAIPFLISNFGYGILFTTQSPSIFSDTQYGSYFYTTADYYLDYFFIAPEEKSKIIACMRQLTGKALIPPKWAFGYVQSQERYETQQEILDTVAEFKKRKIPLSTIILDWLSWEDGMWGQKSLDLKRFPSPNKMIQQLHEDNVHFMISIWPSMDEKCENYKEMKAQDKLLTGINVVNAFEKSARDLYWKQAKEGLAKWGVESWWCDSSEPLTPEWSHIQEQLPENQFLEYVNATSDVMPLEKANAYGYFHAMGMYEGQKKDFPERRMLILTRNGYVGSQKLGVVLWSGDISASWKTLQNQLVAAVQFSLSGVPYWTFDIGGFFVKKGVQWYWNGDYDDTTANAGYRELYTRWLQLGVFLPMFRAHGTDCRREPWAFANESSSEKNIFYNTIVDFIRLRYKLIPYIYSTAAKVWKDDEMFIRPLFIEFTDKNVENISSQFMFGSSIMVCPVTKPMYYDKNGKPLANGTEKTWKVYLPSDCAWYDWWTNKKYDGGQYITVDADITKMPIFVKEGSIIPVCRDESEKFDNSLDWKQAKNIEILRFPDSEGNCRPFELYDDDGETYKYLEGEFGVSLME